MRLLAFALVAVIVLLQRPLWFGPAGRDGQGERGGWMGVARLEAQLAQQKAANETLRRRNEAMLAEVQDLKQGSEAIEERARNDLGMVRRDEIFYRLVTPAPPREGSPEALRAVSHRSGR